MYACMDQYKKRDSPGGINTLEGGSGIEFWELIYGNLAGESGYYTT